MFMVGYADYQLLIPFALFILSIPSSLFNIQSLRKKESLNSKSINSFYWIFNIILGIYIISLSIVIFVIIQKNSPIHQYPGGVIRHGVAFIIFVTGFGIVRNSLKVKQLSITQK